MTGTQLRPEETPEYLARAGVLPDAAGAAVERLGGGVSNVVLQVTWDDDCAVVKQPRPNLAVEDDWPADVVRVHNEAAAARAYREVLRRVDSPARVPGIRFEDESTHVVAMDCAPTGAGTWKSELLDGRVDTGVAAELGRVLGAVHRVAADDASLAEQFANERPFEQLRIDPYHRTTAERHPDLREPIQREIDRITGTQRTLVHGDYSPKNVLVDRAGDAPVPWLIDFEVAHWGDPAFDVAFMLNHLFIKSVHNADQQHEYANAAFAFWDAYTEQVPWDVEAETVAELGILMLARVDGKSPVEYVGEGPTAAALRRIARRTIEHGTSDIDEFAARVAAEAP
ncbi:phosphotransferase family protein [Haloglomus litoreum]|uniref:phosphotransferase family protein n=1 Tax=Haloglomus litoreum TaxID=3034026 RepID=UPI0023E86EAA|nr:aminoglycoside phosphotransferase family protein [Haloglomus sp. DT116]